MPSQVLARNIIRKHRMASKSLLAPQRPGTRPASRPGGVKLGQRKLRILASVRAVQAPSPVPTLAPGAAAAPLEVEALFQDPVDKVSLANGDVESQFRYHGGKYLPFKAKRQLKATIRRYGEMCELTQAVFQPSVPSVKLFDPDPSISNESKLVIFNIKSAKKQVAQMQQNSLEGQKSVKQADSSMKGDLTQDRVCMLPMKLFFAPHPVNGEEIPQRPQKYPFTEEQLSHKYGILEPDSPIIPAGYEVSHYLYGAAGVVDADGPEDPEMDDKPAQSSWNGYVAHSKTLQEVVVVFRGTMLSTEWAQDADFRAYDMTKLIPQATTELKSYGNVYCHRGFAEVYYHRQSRGETLREGESKTVNTLSEQVLKALSDLVTPPSNPQNPGAYLGWTPKTLTITGHSLGGALTNVSAFDIVHSLKGYDNLTSLNIAPSYSEVLERKKRYAANLNTYWPNLTASLQGVTWAQPRVGNEAFKKAFQQKVKAEKWLRLVNDGDMVPKMPFATASWVSTLMDKKFAKKFEEQAKAEAEEGKVTLEPANTATTNPMKGLKGIKGKRVEGVLKEKSIQLGNMVAKTSQALAIKNDPNDKEASCTFVHMGWELRFFPGDESTYPYMHQNLFQGMKAWDAPLYRAGIGAAKGAWNLLQKPVLSWVSELPVQEDPIYLERLGARHNIEVMIHMIDDELDKVRLNRFNSILLMDELKKADPEAWQRLKGLERICWWWPMWHNYSYKIKDDANMIQNNLRLVKQTDGSFKWTQIDE